MYSEIIPQKAGFFVYRLWAADGSCLYVGCVGERGPIRVQTRLGKHRRLRSWWPDVARIEIASFGSSAEVVEEERQQLVALQPKHNRLELGKCPKGHDRGRPGALLDNGTCKQCQWDYRRRSEVRLRNAARNRQKRWRASGYSPAPGQGALW